MVELLRNEPAVGLDIETTGLDSVLDKIRTVQLSTATDTYVIDAYRVPVQELTPLLSGGPVKVLHNARFDAGFLWQSQAKVMPEPVFDTMLADQVINNSRHGRSLKDLAKEYLDVELSKELQTSDWSAETLTADKLAYAANNAAILLPLRQKLVEKADAAGLTQVVDLENRTIPTMVWMERAGVGFDVERWRALEREAAENAAAYEKQLHAITAGYLEDNYKEINWQSNPQIRKTLGALDLEVPDTKHETLEAASDRHPIVRVLIDYREAQKRASTYGDKWTKQLHKATERIHPNWRQIGAETGRMSCSKPNMQNVPRNPVYRECFIPSPGNVFSSWV